MINTDCVEVRRVAKTQVQNVISIFVHLRVWQQVEVRTLGQVGILVRHKVWDQCLND